MSDAGPDRGSARDLTDPQRPDRDSSTHRVVYCLIPYELAPKLHDPLRRHFRDEPDVRVVVERRGRDRRRGEDRRAGERPAASERRRIRSDAGRRVGERRAALVAISDPPPLPRRARAYADRITFVGRVEPSPEHEQDLLAGRLVLAAQAGEPKAFDQLYLRYFDDVYAYLRVALRDRHEAEDRTQEVFSTVLESLPRFELRRGTPFRAWLFRIARNQAVSYLRKSGRFELEDPSDVERRREHDDGGEGLEAVSLSLDWVSDADLMMLIERLPVSQRQVLTLRHMLGLSNKEIAVVLKMTPAAVSQQHSRSTRFLAERLRAARGGGRSRRTPRAPMLIRLRRMPVLGARRSAVPQRGGSARRATTASRYR